jgi:hypothetical protein
VRRNDAICLHALIRNTHVELGKSAQVRLVTLAPVDRTIDDLLLRLGHADGRKRHRLAAGDGNAVGGGGGVRTYAAVASTSLSSSSPVPPPIRRLSIVG